MDSDNRLIPLTQGYNAIVDTADYERVVDDGPWSADVQRCRDGSIRCVYARHHVYDVNGKQTTESLHRFILNRQPGDGVLVDHRDGDGLNNRRSNLRLATPADNARNHKKSANNTSGFVGVSWHEPSRKWVAQVCVDGNNLWLGLYSTAKDAAVARDAAAKHLYGGFARSNFEAEVGVY
jgi:hypothetical protein